MEQQAFEFHQDVKITTWVRNNFVVYASSEEEAIEKIREANLAFEPIGDIYEDDIEKGDSEVQCALDHIMTVEENNGIATIAVYDDNSKLILDNNCHGETEV